MKELLVVRLADNLDKKYLLTPEDFARYIALPSGGSTMVRDRFTDQQPTLARDKFASCDTYAPVGDPLETLPEARSVVRRRLLSALRQGKVPNLDEVFAGQRIATHDQKSIQNATAVFEGIHNDIMSSVMAWNRNAQIILGHLDARQEYVGNHFPVDPFMMEVEFRVKGR